MKCLSKGTSRVDIIATHDWPLGIEQHGNTKELVRKKPYFSAEIQRNELGSLPNRQVLDTVQPKWWFSAHLHVKFTATVDHDATKKITGDVATAKAPLIPSQVKTKVAIVGDTSIPGHYPGGRDVEDAISKVDPVESSMGAAVTKETNFHALQSSCDTISDLTAQMTHFLALDKCLPRRHYLSILHMECGSSKNDACLEYDLEWLAILRKTHNLNSDERRNVKVPETLADILSDDIQWIEDRLKAMNSDGEGNDLDFCLRIPRNFQPTVPFYSDPCFQSPTVAQLLPKMGNPQTDFILELLELDHCVTVPFDTTLTPSKLSAILRCYDKTRIPVGPDENEINIENDETSDMETETKEIPVIDENEIQIDDEDEDESNTTPSESVNCTEVTKEKASAKKARLEQ